MMAASISASAGLASAIAAETLCFMSALTEAANCGAEKLFCGLPSLIWPMGVSSSLPMRAGVLYTCTIRMNASSNSAPLASSGFRTSEASAEKGSELTKAILTW